MAKIIFFPKNAIDAGIVQEKLESAFGSDSIGREIFVVPSPVSVKTNRAELSEFAVRIPENEFEPYLYVIHHGWLGWLNNCVARYESMGELKKTLIVSLGNDFGSEKILGEVPHLQIVGRLHEKDFKADEIRHLFTAMEKTELTGLPLAGDVFRRSLTEIGAGRIVWPSPIRGSEPKAAPRQINCQI